RKISRRSTVPSSPLATRISRSFEVAESPGLGLAHVSDAEPILSLVDIHKSFGSLEVLKGISLDVAAKEVISIIGASGSGKTTLLGCVNLLELPTPGEIFFEKRAIDYRRRPGLFGGNPVLSTLRKQIGMVFQNYNLWPHLTVLENVVEAPVRVKGEPRT